MFSSKIRKVGNSFVVTLPKEALALLRAGEGDTIYLTEAPGGLKLTPYAEDFEEQMEAFEEGRKAYRHALRELAK